MKLHERIDLRLSTQAYDALLLEVGGNPRDVPDLIRTKLDDAISGKTQAQQTAASLKFLTEIVRRLYIEAGENAIVRNDRLSLVDRIKMESRF
jgi:hypothetical protein